MSGLTGISWMVSDKTEQNLLEKRMTYQIKVAIEGVADIVHNSTTPSSVTDYDPSKMLKSLYSQQHHTHRALQ